MKKTHTAFALLVYSIVFSQSSIGINTPTPTETLDVNGTERIRNLPENGTINAIYTKPDGTKSLNRDQAFIANQTLVVDKNGVLGTVNLLPSENQATVLAGTDGKDAVKTSCTISSINGVTGTTPALVTKLFTLKSRSMVTFLFNVSVSTIRAFSGSTLTDGTSKRFGAKLLLNSETIINAGTPFSNSGSQYTSGYFYLNGNRTIILNAGTYTVDLVGTVYAYDQDPVGIKATFGATEDDQLDIIATNF